MVRRYHSTIAAREHQQRHQVGRQRGTGKMGLEPEKVGRLACSLNLAGEFSRFPGSMRGNDHRCAQNLFLLSRLHGHKLQIIAPTNGDGLARLENLDTRTFGGLQQDVVQTIAAERAAETRPGARHSRLGRDIARKEADATYFGAGFRAPGLADAQPVEQGKAGTRHEFAADLSARKRDLLHHCHRPTMLGQRNGGGTAGGAGADDDCVVHHLVPGILAPTKP